ncbi:DegQ family serine endoprotease [Horticoccus sp. 23ND18S-11]|uniref:DegQ family serine endoprotease n=1 Tax=Horticoccus sp. 23ND18S-11 TaxID=3391832 RepID=UPI0039C9B8F3
MNTFTSSSHSLFNRRKALWAAGALALAGAFAAGAQSAGTPAKPAVNVKRDSEPVNRGPLETGSFSSVVKRVAPSVVKITTSTKARKVAANPNQFPGFDNPVFRQFFGGQVPEVQQPPQSGLGSGVIISADGFIATNNHVVQGADEVIVALDDGRELKARVVGRDPQTDIAVIKVDATDLPAITFADSGKIEVGDRVLAIGNPFGIGETVTTGIVSAKGRRPGLGLDYEDFVQTDAAINPGNSGGALVDVEGRLIGINTAILSRTGGFQGVGLAVPANLVSQVADGLVKNGKVVRGYLGVGAQDITPTLAESLGLKARKGALVADVQPDSPAAKGGLKNGDVITAVNGQPIEDSNRLTFSVGAVSPGTKLTLDIIRDGKPEELTLTAAERPGNVARGHRNGRNADPEELAKNDEGVLNGVHVDDLAPQMRSQLNLPARLKGAVITNVDPASPAAKAGLRAGDVILEINKQPVTSAQDAVDLSLKAEGKKTLLRLFSRGSTSFVVVDETDASKNASE